MIRIFPDFSVQVTATAAGGAGAGGAGGGGMVSGPPVGRVPVPVPGATNGTQQGVQGITAYQQRYVVLRIRPVAPHTNHLAVSVLKFAEPGSSRDIPVSGFSWASLTQWTLHFFTLIVNNPFYFMKALKPTTAQAHGSAPRWKRDPEGSCSSTRL